MTENLACTELIFLYAIFSSPNQSPPEANQNEIITLLGNFLSPLWSKAKNESTLLSTQKSALTLKSLFLSGSTLASALLGAFWRALGPPEP